MLSWTTLSALPLDPAETRVIGSALDMCVHPTYFHLATTLAKPTQMNKCPQKITKIEIKTIYITLREMV